MTQMVTTKDKMTSVRQLVERQIPEIKRAVPRGIDPQRFARVALTTFQNVPALLDCTPASLMGALMQAAAWGLELDPVLGQAYLIPYRDKCQLIIGYQGLIELARRSKDVRNVIARAVHEKDEFSYSFGLDETLKHRPFPGEDPGPLTYVYAVAYLSDTMELRGGAPWQAKVFDVMSVADVERIRGRSAAKNSGPWQTDYEAMARKTVIRRLCKYLPKSVELASAVALDEQADRAEQNLTIDVTLPERPALPAGGSLDQLTEKLTASQTGLAVPAVDGREAARAAQAASHELPRAHREPGEEG